MEKLTKLERGIDLKSFNCGIPKLNDFLFSDALNYSECNSAHTYLIQNKAKTIAYISILGDSIDFKLEGQWSKSKQINYMKKTALLPNYKRKKDKYPAIKIGRLGVDNDFKDQGVGKLILNKLVHHILEKNLFAIMFITVDSKESAVGFYEKYGFEHLLDTPEGEGDNKTFPMFLCLSELERKMKIISNHNKRKHSLRRKISRCFLRRKILRRFLKRKIEEMMN